MGPSILREEIDQAIKEMKRGKAQYRLHTSRILENTGRKSKRRVGRDTSTNLRNWEMTRGFFANSDGSVEKEIKCHRM